VRYFPDRQASRRDNATMPGMRMTRTLQLAVAFTILAAVAVGVFRCTRPSGYVNCVVVRDQTSFVGTRLQNTGSTFHKTVSLAECGALDQQHDNSDGSARGRVRWVQCMVGPDCDEAGMF